MKIINLSSLDGDNGFRLDGVADSLWHGQRGDHSGYSVSNAGDVNGDGYDDVIVGAPHANPSREGDGFPLGSSYVVFGKASGFSASMALSSLDGSNGFRLDGGTDNILELSGSSVSDAGDINGDGYGDLVIGAPWAARFYGHSVDGFSYVVFGKASGFSAALDLSSLDGDGFDDVIVGAESYLPREHSQGLSVVVFGKASGFGSPLKLDGNDGFRIVGDNHNGVGSSVSSAGDINGDGFDDVIVGAQQAINYVVFGKATGFNAKLDLSSFDSNTGFKIIGEGGRSSVSNAGDVNGDGFDDLIVGSSVIFGRTSSFGATLDVANLDGNTGFRLNGTDGPISNAGDVNGDGFDDLIVGGTDVNGDGSGSGSGSSYVVYGKASGFSAALDLSNLNEYAGFRLDGVAAGDKSGFSVSGVGDVNGDGFNDLIIGAPEASSNGVTQSGSSYVVFGRSDFGSGGLPEILGTSGDDTLKGTAATEHFKAGDGNDNLIGRGGADIFEGGAGNDVLHLAGNGLNLNLADSGNHISGIEIICLYSKGDSNTLTLTAADLLNLSDTTNTLKVNGNAGGHIIVGDSGWVDGGSRGDGYYHVYTQDDAVLLVGQNLTMDFV